jgi:hypothetical protein
MIKSRGVNGGSPTWVRLGDVKMQEPRDRVSRSRRLQRRSNG